MEYINLEFARWFAVEFIAAGIAIALFFYAESFSYWRVRRNPRAFRIMVVTDWALRGAMLVLLLGPVAWITWRYGPGVTSKFVGWASGLGVWPVIGILLMFIDVALRTFRGGGGQDKAEAERQARPDPRRRRISGHKWR